MPEICLFYELALCYRIIKEGKLLGSAEYKLSEERFKSQLPKLVFQYIKQHFEKYSAYPQWTTVRQHFKEYEFPPEEEMQEPFEYYLDIMLKREKSNVITQHFDKIVSALGSGDLNGVKNEVATILTKFNALEVEKIPSLTTFDEGLKERIKQYLKKERIESISTPWNSLTTLTTGGIKPGALWVICSRPGIGKTQLLCYLASYLWKLRKKILFVTMEMPIASILQRIDSIISKVPLEALSYPELPSFYHNNIQELEKQVVVEGKNLIFVTSSKVVTAFDLHLLIQNIHPDVVLLDGLYLLRSEAKHEHELWEEIAEVVAQLKILTTKMNVPIISTTQFNRTIKRFASSGRLEAIGYSDAIGQFADVVLGLYRNVKCIKERKLKIEIIKNREGESNKEFFINFNFETMNFDESSGITKTETPLDETDNDNNYVSSW